MGTERMLENVRPEPGGRFRHEPNRYGVRWIDHAALPVRDPERSLQFYSTMLGAVVHKAIGFESDEQRVGRVKHIFTHVGTSLIQVGYPHDGKSFPSMSVVSGWPHWAFRVSAPDMDAGVGRLRSLGVPFNGPVKHGFSASVYFFDPDGNKLELVTYDPYEYDGMRAVTAGDRTNADWPSLAYEWQPPEPTPSVRDWPTFPERTPYPQNGFGLYGIDHVALPVRDPELAVRFYEEFLGAAVYMTVGFSERERAVDRAKHVFMHVGDTLVQVGYPHDGITFPDPQNVAGWPHWAFEVPAATIDSTVEKFEADGIPYNGPLQHPGADAISLYFKDIDGNKLHLQCHEPYANRELAMQQGARTNDWLRLNHGWRPDGATGR